MATIKDVARLAGVGVGTASRVISGKGSFSADAAARVEAAARDLSFRPSNIARALSLRSTGTIGVFVPAFRGSFYGPLLNAIDAELRTHGRHMVAANGCGADDSRQQALDGVNFLIERDCDGIVVVSNTLRDADLIALHKRFPRLMVVNREVRGMKSQCFSLDHRAGGALAARTLLDHGHRRIGVIGGPGTANDSRQRLQGFLDALRAARVAASNIALEEGDFSPRSGWDAAGRLLQRKQRITGLFCANDQMAMGAISRLRDEGVDVPGSLSVVGYDDDEAAGYLSPRLTTVRIPIAAMALNACRQLLNTCYDASLPVSQQFEPELVMRDSVVKAA